MAAPVDHMLVCSLAGFFQPQEEVGLQTVEIWLMSLVSPSPSSQQHTVNTASARVPRARVNVSVCPQCVRAADGRAGQQHAALTAAH